MKVGLREQGTGNEEQSKVNIDKQFKTSKIQNPKSKIQNPKLSNHTQHQQRLPIFSQKIQWIDGECKWEEYHLIVEGKRYKAKHKSHKNWLKFYPTKTD